MSVTASAISIKDSTDWNNLLDLVYPVGSFYLSYSSTSPATSLGGTWASVTGKFLYGNASVSTGGANSYNLSATQLPGSYANFYIRRASTGNGVSTVFAGNNTNVADVTLTSTYSNVSLTSVGDKVTRVTFTGGGKFNQQYALLSKLLLLVPHSIKSLSTKEVI